jgi:menaquinol-cytochrome c reductase iron-sulfur subunit
MLVRHVPDRGSSVSVGPSEGPASPAMSSARRGRGTPTRDQDLRRRFLQTVTGLLGGLVGAVAAIPGLALLLHPVRRGATRAGAKPQPVAKLQQLARLRPLRVEMRGELVDAWSRTPDARLGSCWLVREGQAVRAFSTVCPHLGCGIEHDEDRQQFVCPCHRSSFSLAGQRLSGPAPRDLDELPVEIEGDQVRVAHRRYRVGVPTKEEV